MESLAFFPRLLRSQIRSYWLALRVRRTPRRIILGAGGTAQTGWVPTDIATLNVLNDRDWNRYFSPNTIDALMAEHVWEHMTESEGLRAARLCYRYLKPGGYFRLAVPDGLNPDPEYLTYVRPPAQGHRSLFDYRSVSSLLETAGFTVKLLEWFDDQGEFHVRNWDVAAGKIERSSRFDNRGGVSVIADATKA